LGGKLFLVQAMMLLPSLMLSIVWAMRSKDFTIVFMTAASLLVVYFLSKRRSLKPSGVGQPVNFRRDRIFIGTRRLPRSSKLWLPSWRKIVFEHIQNLPDMRAKQTALQQAKERGFAAATAGKLVAWLGITGEGEYEVDLLGSDPHLFVVGPTGSGKSQLLRLILTSLTSRYSSNEIRFYLADFKGSALLHNLPLSAFDVEAIDDLESDRHLPFWNKLADEIETRERMLKGRGLSEFQSTPYGDPQVLLLVDELASACRSSVRAAETIATIAARGRSLGFAVVAANQGMAGVPRELLLNLRTRIALAGTDQVELVQLGGQSAKLKQAELGWIAARSISHSREDCDFSYPLGLT
jgi:energy-coupling factor transporter ATP-binding protein EcfA2